jgi:prophage regulatory protein
MTNKTKEIIMEMKKADPAIDVQMIGQLTGLSKTTVYQYIKDGKFPAGFLFSRRARRWMLSDVEGWIKSVKEGGAV